MANDFLSSTFRKQFLVPQRNGKEQVYFLGNSLGLQPVNTANHITRVLREWSEWGVEGFFEGDAPWMHIHDRLAPSIARIVGALPTEVVVMNQLTVNLHLMMTSFYQPTRQRFRVICESKAFPSDQYMLETHIRFRGLDPADTIIEVQPREGEHHIRLEDILDTIHQNREETALVFWGGVNYYTGQVFDIEAITRAAHEAGAIAGFDLAHAAGNIRLRLHEWNVDFACWCSYKYLNSGPGAIAGAYIHERYHNDEKVPRLAGWWGYRKDTRFLMNKNFEPSPTAEGWQVSTPSPILFAAHQAALDIFDEADMDRVAAEGFQLSGYLFHQLEELRQRGGRTTFEILTPADDRGCQVSLYFSAQGRRIFEQLTQHGIFADWREPGVIRVAPVPLYNTYQEVDQFIGILKQCIL